MKKQQQQKKQIEQKQKQIEQKQKQIEQKQKQKEIDHAAKAVEVRSAYKSSVEGKVKTGMILADYQAALADDREFTDFWRDHLHWPKTTVYRLVDLGKHFAHLPGQTLAWFDLSALYLLAGKRAKPAVRKKAIKQAEGGTFVTHAQVRAWLGKKPKKPTAPAIPPRPGTIRIDLDRLTAEAEKLELDAGRVVELWERLGVGVDWLGGKKPVETAKSSKQTKKGVT